MWDIHSKEKVNLDWLKLIITVVIVSIVVFVVILVALFFFWQMLFSARSFSLNNVSIRIFDMSVREPRKETCEKNDVANI